MPFSRNASLLKQYTELQLEFLANRKNPAFGGYLLNKRKLSKDIVKRFELGYNTRIFSHKKKGEPLIGKDAITIPIRDFRGRIVAFQSRFVVNPVINGIEYRYFNSEILPFVYEKIKWLYNLEQVLKDYYDRSVYVVEGAFDLFSLAVAGIDNVVATIGNRLSVETTELLLRYFDKVTFILDNDEGGSVVLDFKNPRIWNLELYKIQVSDIGEVKLKDINDMLIVGIDIQQYIKDKSERMAQ